MARELKSFEAHKIADATASSGSFVGWLAGNLNRSTVFGHYDYGALTTGRISAQLPALRIFDPVPIPHNYFTTIYKYSINTDPWGLVISEPRTNYLAGVVATTILITISDIQPNLNIKGLGTYGATSALDPGLEKQSWYAELPVSNKTKIYSLNNFRLKSPIPVTVEFDRDYFIAKCDDLPLHSFGDSRGEAIENLKDEIEEVYLDLVDDDNVTTDWARHKDYLVSRIVK